MQVDLPCILGLAVLFFLLIRVPVFRIFFQKQLRPCQTDCREAVEALVDLTLAFKEVFDAKKRDKNILDFNDIEHFALSILVRRDGEGRCVPT